MSFSPRDVAAPVVESGPRIEWEETSCLLCGNRHCNPLVEAPDSTTGGTGMWFAVVQCQECGLCYTNPRPSAQSIGQFYPAAYRPHRTRQPRPPRWKPRWLPLTGPTRRQHPILSWQGPGRLLDFGCGGGAFLAHMSRLNWDVTGLDVSPTAVDRIQNELGLPALLGTLPHPDLRPASFDVVTMWHSLEHVHDPMETLREARRLLVPGGRLIIAVPNIDSLPFRWFGSSWYGLDLPRHLTHFAPGTLHLMLERSGFHVGPIRMVRHSDWLRYSARLASQNSRGPGWHRWLQAKPASRLAAVYCSFTHQCDCMTVMAER